MIKNIVIFYFLLVSISLQSQNTITKETVENYNVTVDSLLNTIWSQIKADLSQKGYVAKKLTPDEISFDGHIMVLEIFFTPEKSWIFAVFGVSDQLREYYVNQKKGFGLRKFYYNNFKTYIRMHGKIPVDYLTYKFMTEYENSPQNHTLFGNYSFRMNEIEEFEIEESEIEVLRNEKEFYEKYNSEF
ncbi:MAG: hypothetical protein ACOCYO_07070 [Bacteroidota bacterium]